MKKLLLILFMFPMLAMGQHHMMSVLASQDGWDYEGIMTVGLHSDGIDFYGYQDAFYQYGSMSPTNIQVAGLNETKAITYYVYESQGYLFVSDADGAGNKTCNTIEIDGVEFTGFDAYGSLEVESNPFPAPGQTCTIKLK